MPTKLAKINSYFTKFSGSNYFDPQQIYIYKYKGKIYNMDTTFLILSLYHFLDQIIFYVLCMFTKLDKIDSYFAMYAHKLAKINSYFTKFNGSNYFDPQQNK